MSAPLFWLLGVALAGNDYTVFEYSESADPTAEVLAILGPQVEWHSGDRLEFGVGLEAEIYTDIDCGAIKFGTDFELTKDQLAQLPQELAATGTTILKALPMLTLCHTSPSLCAELKNLNLRIDEEWSLQAQVCQSMDDFIDETSSEFEQTQKEAEERAMNRCVVDQMAAGLSDRDALATCEADVGAGAPLDIASGFLGTVISDGPQKLVESALQATQSKLSQEERFYDWLVSIGGEFEIEHNGEVIPIFPESGSHLAEELANTIGERGQSIACGPLDQLKSRLIDEPVTTVTNPTFGRGEDEDEDEDEDSPGDGLGVFEDAEFDTVDSYWRDEMDVTLLLEFTEREATNLDDLDTGDYYLWCEVMGSTWAAATARRLQTITQSETAMMSQNPSLGVLGKAALRNLETAMNALVRQYDDAHALTPEEFRVGLETVAERTRVGRRGAAAALAAGEARNRKLLEDVAPCTSALTCRSAP